MARRNSTSGRRACSIPLQPCERPGGHAPSADASNSRSEIATREHFDQAFEVFATTEYPRFATEIADALQQHTHFALLERLTLKLIFVLRAGHFRVHGTAAAVVITQAIVRAANEAMAIVGTLRVGSLLGVWHHLRSMLELHAMVKYIFSDESEQANRVQRFLQFEELEAYRHARRVRGARWDGIPEKEIPAADVVTPARIEQWKQKEPIWVRLYGAKDPDQLAVPRPWHKPKISDLVDATEPHGGAMGRYRIYSYSTHMTALAGRANEGALLGFAPARAREVVGYTLVELTHVLTLLAEVSGRADLVEVLLRAEYELVIPALHELYDRPP